MFNIKKGIVHGYNHNAPGVRDANLSTSNPHAMDNAPKIKKSKALAFITGKYNAPAVAGKPKGGKFGK